MNDFIQTLGDRKGELLSATFEHLSISISALLIAAVIAIPLAIWLVQHKKIAEVVLQITSVLQTIPSLALLGLLIPFVGIGTVPALIALVIYALLPIFQNTYIGLTEIDESLLEAADAFGMSRFRRLRKVEIPLALPMIISGIRTALVLIIGTATLAALIGAGGLGTFILLGIDRNNPTLTLIGAISSALLAVIFSSLIKYLQNKRPRVVLLVLAGLIVAIGGLSLSQSSIFQPETIVVAGKLGSEPDILANMYKELIEDEENVQVEVKPNFGKTSFLFSALDNEQIDIYPEFTGTVLESLVKVPDKDKESQWTSEEAYEKAKKLLEEQFEMTFLPPMTYQNTYALAVKKDFAQEHNLQSISDLTALQDQIKAGFTLEFSDREDGYKGIQETYGIDFSSVQSMEPALRYQAIDNGDIQIIDAYSTDSEIKEYDLVTLEDDQHLFPPYQGAPLMKTEFANDHPETVNALEKLSDKITEEEMIDMNYQVNVEEKDPASVAHAFLVEQGLIKEGTK